MHRLTATDTPMVRYTRTIFPSYAYMAFESKDIYNERKIFNSVEYTKKDHGIHP